MLDICWMNISFRSNDHTTFHPTSFVFIHSLYAFCFKQNSRNMVTDMKTFYILLFYQDFFDSDDAKGHVEEKPGNWASLEHMRPFLKNLLFFGFKTMFRMSLKDFEIVLGHIIFQNIKNSKVLMLEMTLYCSRITLFSQSVGWKSGQTHPTLKMCWMKL